MRLAVLRAVIGSAPVGFERLNSLERLPPILASGSLSVSFEKGRASELMVRKNLLSSLLNRADLFLPFNLLA